MPKILTNESERLATRVPFNLRAGDHKQLVKIAANRRVPFGQILRELVRQFVDEANK